MTGLAQIVSEDQDNSLLGNLSRWLGRPGYAVRSLLRGEVGDAGENLLQMGLDLPTFGMLNRNLSLGNLFSETGDITTKRERPEFSDLVDYRGQGLGRIGVDVVGGMLTDPLTYLTFGGSGLAKGSLTGMSRGAAAASAGSALRQTARGAARLSSATDDVLRNLRGPLGKAFGPSGPLNKLDDLATASDDVLEGIFKGIGSAPARREAAAKAARRLEANAIDNLLPSGVRLGRATAGDALDNGIKQLADDGALLANDALRLDIPFTDVNIPLVGNIWGKIGGATAPGIGLKVLRIANAPAADLVEAAGKSAWGWTKNTFYDRIAKSGINAGLQHVVRKAGLKHAGDLKRAAITTRNVFDGLDDESVSLMGKLMAETQDDYARLAGELLEAGEELTPAHVTRMKGELLRKVSAGGHLADGTRFGGLGKDGMRALNGYLDAMGEIPGELVKLGVWKHKDANPFYLPHQVQPLLMELMGDPLARKNTQLMRGIKNVFDGKRKFKTAKEFAAYVTEGMDMASADVPEILKQLADFGEDAMDYDLRGLMFKRLAAHASTVKRSTIWNEGVRQGMKVGPKSAGDEFIRSYVEGQIKGVGAPDNAIYKLMAGGKIKMPVGSEQAARLKAAGATIRTEAGQEIAEFSMKGVNHYVKPLLTSFPTNPAFHIRNWIGAAFMSTLDPDLGWPAFSELVGSFPGAAWSSTMGNAGKSRKLTAMVIEAANGSSKAMDDLAKSGAMFGKYTAREAVEAIQNGVGKVSQADLATNLGDDLAELMGKAAVEEGRGKAGRLYDAMVKVGEKAANHTEEGMRTSSIIRLMEKGVDPSEAIRRTNRAFVDYSSQSVAESWARQVLPFAKFAIGSTAWLGEFARRPRLLGPITHARNSAAAQLGPDEVLPERVADSLALPLSKDGAGNMRYITSLGLPHESALNMLSAASSFSGFRKNILGALHPLGKFPLEAATNRDFFFGDEHGSYTKAPNMLPKVLTTEVTGKDGAKRYEIPGFWREVWDAMPTSRAAKTIDRFMDEKRPLLDATMQSVTGTRIQGVDQKRELRSAIERYLKAKVEAGQVVEFSNWVAKGDPDSVPEDLKVVLAGLRDMRKKKRK